MRRSEEGGGAALVAWDSPFAPGTATKRGKDSPREEAQHVARKGRGVRQAVAQGKGHGEHPLTNGHLGQDPVHQVCGGISHAPAAA
jgi:hypothetical protein